MCLELHDRRAKRTLGLFVWSRREWNSTMVGFSLYNGAAQAGARMRAPLADPQFILEDRPLVELAAGAMRAFEPRQVGNDPERG